MVIHVICRKHLLCAVTSARMILSVTDPEARRGMNWHLEVICSLVSEEDSGKRLKKRSFSSSTSSIAHSMAKAEVTRRDPERRDTIHLLESWNGMWLEVLLWSSAKTEFRFARSGDANCIHPMMQLCPERRIVFERTILDARGHSMIGVLSL